MIPENGLILRASDLSLKPRLRLPVVGNLQGRCTIANLGEVGHAVSDCDGSVDAPVTSDVKNKNNPRSVRHIFLSSEVSEADSFTVLFYRVFFTG